MASDTLVSFIPMNNLGLGGQPVSGHVCKPISEVYKGYTYFADGDVLLAKITPCFENGKLGIASGLENSIGFGSSEFMVLRPGPRLSARYLAYFLSQDRFRELGCSAMTGAVGHKRIPKEWVENFEIPVPPLVEQQRVVAVLDEAFEGIVAATVRTEKNLLNANDLFRVARAALFSSRDSSWTIRSLGAICENLDGQRRPVTKRNRVSGNIPYYGASGVVDHVQSHLFDEELLLVSEDGANLLARTYPIAFSISGPSWVNNHAHVLRFSDTRTQIFVENYLNSIDLSPYVTGMAQPKLNQGALNKIPVPVPPIKRQAEIVASLEELHSQTQTLAGLLKQKLAALAELKRSLLARAFSGELVQEPSTAADDNYFSTPEQVANILAVIHWRHEKARRDKTYGHVKAQKALHLVEHIGGVELGRESIKDAAGPNDFEHMKRAEKWAKDNLFFEFVERAGGGYEFKKLSNHGALLSAAKQALKPIEGAIDRINNLIVSMDSEAAEVLATVHAAWNNLLAEGKEATPDAIVREARDDWHPSKMLIAESKFRDAIKLIKAKGIIPDGTAKPVLHRQLNLL